MAGRIDSLEDTGAQPPCSDAEFGEAFSLDADSDGAGVGGREDASLEVLPLLGRRFGAMVNQSSGGQSGEKAESDLNVVASSNATALGNACINGMVQLSHI